MASASDPSLYHVLEVNFCSLPSSYRLPDIRSLSSLYSLTYVRQEARNRPPCLLRPNVPVKVAFGTGTHSLIVAAATLSFISINADCLLTITSDMETRRAERFYWAVGWAEGMLDCSAAGLTSNCAMKSTQVQSDNSQISHEKHSRTPQGTTQMKR